MYSYEKPHIQTDKIRTIPQLLHEIQQQFPDTDAQWRKDNKGQYHPTTYKVLYADVISFAAGLKSLGIKRGDHSGLLSDNRRERMVADLAVLSLGAADVPQGRDAMPYGIRYILDFSGCRYCCTENEDQLKKVETLLPELPDPEYLIVLDPQFEKPAEHISVAGRAGAESGAGKQPRTVQLLTFPEILETGRRTAALYRQ